jgi:adenosylcobinamide-phosphate synthase
MRPANKLILTLALALDGLLGDPPNRFHPVAWMGQGIAWAQQFRPHGDPAAELAYGAGLALGGGMFVGGVAALLERLTRRLPGPVGWLAQAALLKATFSLRGLDRAAASVQEALQRGDLPEARRLLSWHLVSRDTAQLSAAQAAGAAIESVAENASDGVIAPLLAYILGGLPLAFAYRFVNTADAMLGYHDADREWLGKAPARLDDLANLFPARLTGALLGLAARLGGADGRRAWQVMRRDARLTASPNAGIPMSAMAGALGVELEKTGAYRLGAEQRTAGPADIARARRLLLITVALAAGLAWLLPVRRR